jgi:pheromone shutdown protein TraB
MIILLGTSHVSKQSSREVHQAVGEADIVAIELDPGRAAGLLSKREATFSELREALGVKGALMASVMRSIQKRIAKSVGVIPGLEMKTALSEAQKQKKTVALIDRDIRITLKRLTKAFGWREIKQMGKDMFRRREMPLHPSDELVVELIAEMRTHYPRIYQVMVHERDIYMARALVYLSEQNPEKTIVAIVGKGHIPGMLEQINYINKQAAVKVWSSPERK